MLKAVLLMAAGVLAAQTVSAAPATIRVPQGGALVMELESAAATLIVADPVVADVSPMSDSKILLLGRSPGKTTLLALDSEGKNLIEATVLVAPSADWTVKVSRGTRETMLVCTPNCTVSPGETGGAPGAKASD